MICFMSRRPKSEATNTNFTRQPGVQTTQLNDPAPPILPPQHVVSSSQPYRIPGEYVVEPFIASPSTHVGVNKNALGPQIRGRLVVQEEDAGTLPAPEENVVRLPSDYKEA